MATKVKAIPDGYHSVTPYLSIKGAGDAIEFYKKAFGAREVMRMPQPDGRVGHAEIQLGDSRVMLADEFPEMDFRSPQSIGGTPVHLHVYVEDADALVKQAVAAGRQARPPGPGSVLRRPAGHRRRSVRPRVAPLHPQGRPVDGRDQEARRRPAQGVARPDQMAIFLIRHGETLGNAARVVQRPDNPLSPRGVAQAERLARRLTHEGIARILSSDLARAAMTAEHLRRATGAPVAHDAAAPGAELRRPEGHTVLRARPRHVRRGLCAAQRRDVGGLPRARHPRVGAGGADRRRHRRPPRRRHPRPGLPLPCRQSLDPPAPARKRRRNGRTPP